VRLRRPRVWDVLVVAVLVSNADDAAKADEEGDVFVTRQRAANVKTERLVHVLDAGRHFNPPTVVVALDAQTPRLPDATPTGRTAPD